MVIKSITFQQTFPTGIQYQNQRLGMEIDITPQDDIQAVFLHAKNTVEEIFKAMNPHVGEVHTYSTLPSETIDPEADAKIKAELEVVKNKMIAAKTFAEAEEIFKTGGFSFNIELKQILNDKKNA